MPSLIDLAYSGGGMTGKARPWPRAVIDRDAWSFAAGELASGRWSLCALWGEPGAAHMALRDETSQELGIFTLPCPDNRFPSVGRMHAPAIRLERAMRDLWGLTAENAPDARPWLDHGKWESKNKTGVGGYAFLSAEGENLHQVAVGPVHAGIIEPGHFRFTASGETVVRLEERLGYAHKGVERLMIGADLESGLTLAERISGDSTIAYAIAYCRTVEAALDVRPPPRAEWLRALALELERIANHLGDFGAVCNDAAFSLIHAHCAILREDVLRAAEAAFGSRLMRGVVIPGGVRASQTAGALEGIRELADRMERRLDLLNETYEETSSLQDRTATTGKVTAALVARFGAGGYVGRASGRAFDARKAHPFPPYDSLDFETPVLSAGDVDARVRIRILEIRQSLKLVRQIILQLPGGRQHVDAPSVGEAREGAAIVEGFRGDIFASARLSSDGRIERCHMRDPSWFQWPLLEAAIEGNIIADFPLCNKSFNCSYSGHDL
ncbi:MAG: hydrogenase expression protein HypE [Parvularculaceae bacterium]